MPVTYEDADSTTNKLMEQVKKKHQDLTKYQVNVGLSMASGKDGTPSVKVGGYETFGKVTFCTTQQRKHGSPDARVTMDAAVWQDTKGGAREAMIDHLLEQIEVRTTEKGEVIRDTANRPKLKRKRFDIKVQGFARIVEEHGADAPESQQFKEVAPKFAQLKLFDAVGAAAA